MIFFLEKRLRAWYIVPPSYRWFLRERFALQAKSGSPDIDTMLNVLFVLWVFRICCKLFRPIDVIQAQGKVHACRYDRWFAVVWCRKISFISLRWRHSGRDGVSNHQPHDCLHNRLFGRRSKKTPKPRVTGPCVGNSPGNGEFPAQMASNAETVSIWWRHLVLLDESSQSWKNVSMV